MILTTYYISCSSYEYTGLVGIVISYIIWSHTSEQSHTMLIYSILKLHHLKTVLK